MKIRTGFVSNSSSSSFTCEICGSTESGYDISPRDLGFYSCVNEHVFCESHLIEADLDLAKENCLSYIIEMQARYAARGWGKISITQEDVNEQESIGELIDLFVSNFGGVPEACCPICSLEVVRDNDLLNYVLKMSNISKEKLTEQIKQNHPTFEKMIEFLYGDKK